MASLIVQIGRIWQSLLVGAMQMEQLKSSVQHSRRCTPDMALSVYKTIKEKRLGAHGQEFILRNIHPATVSIGEFVRFFSIRLRGNHIGVAIHLERRKWRHLFIAVGLRYSARLGLIQHKSENSAILPSRLAFLQMTACLWLIYSSYLGVPFVLMETL